MRKALLLSAIAVLGMDWIQAEENVQIQLHGQGWSDMGRIQHVTDTLVNNLNGNWQQSAGAQFTAKASIGDNWEGAFGYGGYQVYSSLGNSKDARLVRFTLQNFITESRMTYFHGGRENANFSLTFGNFPFIYNKNAKNLGAYLLRGPVYPGFLMGGFKDFKIDSTKGNVLGINAHHVFGNFSHDIILTNERELPPTGDWSAVYLARYQVASGFEIGAGANFYRVLPNNAELTTPNNPAYFSDDNSLIHDGKKHHPYEYEFIEVDTITHDTVFYTHKGIKLMGMFSWDIKSLFEYSSLRPNDLKLYGEAAVLGIQNYGSVYHNIMERVPWTLGFNIPTWGLLDFLSLEVEWYGAKYRNDLGKTGNYNTVGGGITTAKPTKPSPIPSPIPMSYLNYATLDSEGYYITLKGDTVIFQGTNLDMQNLTQDNWKWSLYLEKSILDHVRFIGQIANDHFRPRPTADLFQEIGGSAEAFSSLKDWYWMFRVGYYF